MLRYLRNKIDAAGGRGFLVGGQVRHKVMNTIHNGVFGPYNGDWDIEVYGLNQEEFETRFLSEFPGVDMVGKVFGVYRFHIGDQEVQINLPTIRKSIGFGHKDEVAFIVPDLDYKEACKRRNFTINAMMVELNDGRLLDFFNGVEHCEKRLLVPTSGLFIQDPLRVLNGLKLAGMYGFYASKELKDISCNLSNVPMERIWGEWWAWASRSVNPAYGLLYLADMHLLPKMLEDLQRLPQDPIWHPEGGVYVHTAICTDSAALVAMRDELEAEDRGILVLSALCHDLGKLTTTGLGTPEDVWPIEFFNRGMDEEDEGYRQKVVEWTRTNPECRWRSPGHDKAGEPLTYQFLSSIGCPLKMQDKIVELVGLHMAHINNMKPKKLKSKLRLNSPEMWLRLVEADHSARPPLPAGIPESAKKLFESVVQIPAEEIKPIITGQHLMEWTGLKPGKDLGYWKKRMYEAQLEEKFTTLDGGKKFFMFLWDETGESK